MKISSSLNWDLLFRGSVRFWQIPDNILNGILAQLPKSLHVLDIGCGRGELALHLTNKGRDVFGIDSSPQAIDIAKKNCPTAQFAIRDIEQDQIQGVYDVTFMKHFLAFTKNKSATLKLVATLSPSVVLITPVLLDTGMPTEKELRISIYQAELETLLISSFKDYVVFYEEWVSPTSKRMIYICNSDTNPKTPL